MNSTVDPESTTIVYEINLTDEESLLILEQLEEIQTIKAI